MRSIHGTNSLLLACALALAVLVPGCKAKTKPPAPQAKAEAQIQPSQLQGRWLISSMDGGSVDASMVQTHELEFSADQVRSVFIDSKGSGQGGIFAWRVSGSTLTLIVDPFSKATRSTRISIDGGYLVLEPGNPFPVSEDFRSRTAGYRKE